MPKFRLKLKTACRCGKLLLIAEGRAMKCHRCNRNVTAKILKPNSQMSKLSLDRFRKEELEWPLKYKG